MAVKNVSDEFTACGTVLICNFNRKRSPIIYFLMSRQNPGEHGSLYFPVCIFCFSSKCFPFLLSFIHPSYLIQTLGSSMLQESDDTGGLWEKAAANLDVLCPPAAWSPVDPLAPSQEAFGLPQAPFCLIKSRVSGTQLQLLILRY